MLPYCFEDSAELSEVEQSETAIAKEALLVSFILHGFSHTALSFGVAHCPSWMDACRAWSHLRSPSPGSQLLSKLASCLNE